MYVCVVVFVGVGMIAVWVCVSMDVSVVDGQDAGGGVGVSLNVVRGVELWVCVWALGWA